MIISRALQLAPFALAALAACAHQPQAATPGLAPPAGATSDVVDACELAAERCARCHPIARVKLAHIESPQHWAWYVSRMRHQPRSGITDDDEARIVRCLVARSFGLEALATYDRRPPPAEEPPP